MKVERSRNVKISKLYIGTQKLSHIFSPSSTFINSRGVVIARF